MIHTFENKTPKIGKNCFVAPSSELVGDIELCDGASVWFGAVIRADVASIRIGKNSNIQDNCIFHVSKNKPTKIGDNVSVGHGAIVHSADIADDCIIGMGAILLTGSKIGKNCIIGAGSLITEGTVIPDGSIVVGVPGKVIKQMTIEHKKQVADGAAEYIRLVKEYSNL